MIDDLTVLCREDHAAGISFFRDTIEGNRIHHLQSFFYHRGSWFDRALDDAVTELETADRNRQATFWQYLSFDHIRCRCLRDRIILVAGDQCPGIAEIFR